MAECRYGRPALSQDQQKLLIRLDKAIYRMEKIPDLSEAGKQGLTNLKRKKGMLLGGIPLAIRDVTAEVLAEVGRGIARLTKATGLRRPISNRDIPPQA